jgi:hypothetical protein
MLPFATILEHDTEYDGGSNLVDVEYDHSIGMITSVR